MLFGVPVTVANSTICHSQPHGQGTRTSKDLGITLDTRLSYGNHVTNLLSSFMSKLFQINRIRHLFHKKMLIMIINSLVFSEMYYCSPVWVLNLRSIQCIQTFAIRTVALSKSPEMASGCKETLTS